MKMEKVLWKAMMDNKYLLKDTLCKGVEDQQINFAVWLALE